MCGGILHLLCPSGNYYNSVVEYYDRNGSKVLVCSFHVFRLVSKMGVGNFSTIEWHKASAEDKCVCFTCPRIAVCSMYSTVFTNYMVFCTISLPPSLPHSLPPPPSPSLQALFVQFQHSSQSALPPDDLREALARCYQEQHRFQLGIMDDAAECFVRPSTLYIPYLATKTDQHIVTFTWF